MLSLALSTPASASQTAAVANGRDLSRPVSLGQDSPMVVQQAESFDPIAIQPDSEICYKIRTYIFSAGSNPKLLRETTCGPKRPSSKKIDGKPEFVPLDMKAKPDGALEK
jgi:hypothetical protein